MTLETRKYLTISDASTYFIRKTRHRLDLEDLRQLEREGRVTPLVYLDVNFINNELPDEALYSFDLINIKDIKRVKGYFKPNNFILLDYYDPAPIDPVLGSFSFARRTEYLIIRDGRKAFELVEEVPKKTSDLAGKLGYVFSKDTKSENGFFKDIDTIDIDNVLILRSELDEIIGSIKNNDKERIKQLEQQLEQAKANQLPEGQGDTLLILGAVMESIREVAKPNYTQTSLIDAILDKYGNTSGISESTLKKKFPEAKNYLKQRFKP